MKLVRVNPFYSEQGVGKLFNELLSDGLNYDRYSKNELTYNPATNVYETDESFRLEITVPGFEKEQVNLSIENDLLAVKGEVYQEKETEYKYSRLEFKPQSFEKSYRLSEKIDQVKIEASFKNGILEVILPKKKEAVQVKRKIEVV